MTIGSAARRLDRLEQAIAPALEPEPIHILRVIIDPSDGNIATAVIARSRDGDRQFTLEPGETKDALCERAARAMGWRE